VVGSCEHGNETLDSMKGGEIFDQLSGYIFSGRALHHGVKLLSLNCYSFYIFYNRAPAYKLCTF
jgi:hypothetical protein